MMLKRLIAAFAGRALWLKLDRKYKFYLNGLYVLLMPDDDREMNELALKYIDRMLSHRQGKGVVILSDQNWVLENGTEYSDKVLAIQRLTGTQVNNILTLCELYEFSERLLTVSLDKPFVRKTNTALGLHGITKEDIVCLCIYRIRDWRPVES